MKRRKFLANSSLTFGFLPAFGMLEGSKNNRNIRASFELNEWSVARLQKAMQSGNLTSVEIVKKYLQRINEIDKQGPSINSIVFMNKNVLEQAASLDDERRKGIQRGPLHGIPVLLKDNIDTSDMPTTAGSLALRDSVPSNNAFIVQKLREAGAVILGKTNLSEWANFRSTRSSSGWSGLGGQTKNPYALNRNPCGSSSGSGAAVSANLAAVAVGTETDGSVVCPSNANGIVGIKPTVGLLSRSGIIPISKTQDTAGPMCRTVEDAAILLGAMAGVDEQDPATQQAKGKIHSDYTQFLNKEGLEGKKIGIARGRMGFHEAVDQLMDEVIQVLKKSGSEVVDIEKIFTKEGVHDAEYTVLLYEFKDGLNKYLRSLENPKVKNLTELIEFNKANAATEMPYFKQEIFIQANEKGDLSSQEYLDALKLAREGSRDEGIDRVMDEMNLDAIMAPTGGPAWVTDLITGDHFLGGSSSAAAISGYPNITVPAGFIHELPVGVSFFGRAFSEPLLLEIAYAYEQLTNHRQPPKFIRYV